MTKFPDWQQCGGAGHHPGYRSDSYCGDCPPRTCDGCGKPDSHAAPCACWISMENDLPADIKAMFAEVGLGVDADGAVHTGARP
jgi:hypothetical protein